MKRVMLALLALTLCCVMLAHAQDWPEENHYKVYNVIPPHNYVAPVQLADQFGSYFVDTFFLEKFANPVHKNQEPIFFPEVHQTWWKVDLAGAGWRVVISNQFGDQAWQVNDPQYLVLPARKYEPGPPLQHNHYLAYSAFGEPIHLDVNLIDQFGIVDAVVMEPLYLLNPVEKVHDGVLYPIIDPQAHLACYRIDPPLPYDIWVIAFDQFNHYMEWELMVADHDCLCVPSWKSEVVQTEARSWSNIKNLYRD